MDVNLVLFKKDGSRKAFSLPSTVTIIGRRHNCDLCIPLKSVSKRHCQLNQDEGVLKIRDLGSRNGTILNGKRIDEATIQAGDAVKIGPLAFVFQIDGQPKTIGLPNWVAQKLVGQKGPASPKENEQFANAVEVDDSEPQPEELDSLEDNSDSKSEEREDDLDSLSDDFDSLPDDLESLDDDK
jgi:pSer/pThr/pTyr-binding forkhead associated (FHA) protein